MAVMNDMFIDEVFLFYYEKSNVHSYFNCPFVKLKIK